MGSSGTVQTRGTGSSFEGNQKFVRRLIRPGVSIIGKEADEGHLVHRVRDPAVLLMVGCS